MSVYEILNKYSASNLPQNINFVSDCKKYIDSGMDFPKAFRKSVEQNKLLKNEEKSKLVIFGETFGTSSVETQLDIIRYYKAVFEDKFKESKSECVSKAQTGLYVCTFIGLGMFILFI